MPRALHLACTYKLCKIHKHFVLIMLLYMFGSSVHLASTLLLSYAMPSAYTSMRAGGGLRAKPQLSLIRPGSRVLHGDIDKGILKGELCLVRDHDRTGRRKRS